MHKVYLGIGGNKGNKHVNFIKVARLTEERLGKILKSSSVYETPPWGFVADENFWNQVFLIKTTLAPQPLLDEIHRIEAEFGRKRGSGGYASREMDIDILYYDSLIIENERLTVPHPQIGKRKFVLVPLVEIAPGFVHPLLQKSNFSLLRVCSDHSIITRIDSNDV